MAHYEESQGKPITVRVRMELKGKTAVVTGASRGIGRALSFALARAGCSLILTALEEDELVSVACLLSDTPDVSVRYLPADLTADADRDRFVDWIRTEAPPPDLLINNAGRGYFGRFAASDPTEIERIISLVVRVPVLLTRQLLPLLRVRPSARIVNVSSAVARLPYPGLAVYGSAKAFLSAFSQSLACELLGSNVSVLCFHPGFTDTHFMSSARMDMRRVPRFIIHTPEQVADRIVRAIEKDRVVSYSDSSGPAGVFLANLLPPTIRIRVFRNLFWRLPDED